MLAQELGHAWRLDLGPLLERPLQQRLERVGLRALRRAPVARRLVRLNQAASRPPVDPQPAGDLALRDAIRRHRLRPLQRAPHLPRPSCLNRPNRPSVSAQAVITSQTGGALFAARFGAVLGARRQLDRYRADYGAADDIKPLATYAEGDGRWNRCCRVEANPAPPSSWRCERVRKIERPLRRLRYDTGLHDGLFGRRIRAATYERKATVAAKAVDPLSTTYATRAEGTRASPLRCHARAGSVGTRPWGMDVR
jgi:hypothetical protein